MTAGGVSHAAGMEFEYIFIHQEARSLHAIKEEDGEDGKMRQEEKEEESKIRQ